MIALLSQWRLIGAIGLAALVALAAGWALVERAERHALSAQLSAQLVTSQGQLDQAAKANAGIAASLIQLRVDHARQTALLAAETSRVAARARQAQTIKEGIRHATAQDDGPVAPVLSDALDRLRRTLAAPDGGKPSGARDPAPVAVDLPGKP
jgi:hypothetical protein